MPYFKSDDKKWIIERQDGTDEPAYKNMETLKEFILKFRIDQNHTTAVLYQATVDLIENDKKNRAEFLQNISEYFFENLWQDDKR